MPQNAQSTIVFMHLVHLIYCSWLLLTVQEMGPFKSVYELVGPSDHLHMVQRTDPASKSRRLGQSLGDEKRRQRERQSPSS